MAADRTVIWSKEADREVEVMAAFIRKQWTDREVAKFYDLLEEFERLVVLFPFGWPASHAYPGCRRAIIHRNASVVYRVVGHVIHVITVIDNRSSRPR